MAIIKYQCLACKATVINMQGEVPRSCKKCGSGSAWMKEIERTN